MARYDPFARYLLTVLMDGVAYVARKHAPLGRRAVRWRASWAGGPEGRAAARDPGWWCDFAR